MLDRFARFLFQRLGRRYKLVFVATSVPASVLVALGMVGLLASYYHPSPADAIVIALATSGFTVAGVVIAISRQRSAISWMAEWDAADATAEETIAAWDIAANYPMRSYRSSTLLTNSIAALPSITV